MGNVPNENGQFMPHVLSYAMVTEIVIKITIKYHHIHLPSKPMRVDQALFACNEIELATH